MSRDITPQSSPLSVSFSSNSLFHQKSQKLPRRPTNYTTHDYLMYKTAFTRVLCVLINEVMQRKKWYYKCEDYIYDSHTGERNFKAHFKTIKMFAVWHYFLSLGFRGEYVLDCHKHSKCSCVGRNVSVGLTHISLCKWCSVCAWCGVKRSDGNTSSPDDEC